MTKRFNDWALFHFYVHSIYRCGRATQLVNACHTSRLGGDFKPSIKINWNYHPIHQNWRLTEFWIETTKPVCPLSKPQTIHTLSRHPSAWQTAHVKNCQSQLSLSYHLAVKPSMLPLHSVFNVNHSGYFEGHKGLGLSAFFGHYFLKALTKG